MKATKLLCGIAAMALAFAACNKVDQPANESDNLKSIAVDFGNILSTKSVDTPAPSAAITVNNLQVFFTDGTNFYQAKDADGDDAVQYFSANAVSNASHVYHFLPAAVTDVIVVANLGNQPFANVAALEKAVVDASTQQANSNVALYGKATAKMSATQPDAANHTADYYEATVNLSTRVARIEVEGFEYAAVDGKRVYQSIVVDKIAVANYGLTCNLVSGALLASSATADISTPTRISTYLKDLSGWMVDAPEGATLSSTNNYAWAPVIAGAEGAEDVPQVYSYSVIPTAVPNICVALRGKVDADAADDTATPLFLATKALNDGTAALESLEAGHVYRLKFAFDDNALNTQGKCINVTVTVDSWVIVPVTPEF